MGRKWRNKVKQSEGKKMRMKDKLQQSYGGGGSLMKPAGLTVESPSMKE